ncbi:MAG: nitroreductase family protein [Gammaproteobacteria bacterium]|jgi:nitroreductase|nr:nitroreductase family protein [Gammaproteobacteria bacterium]
MTDILRFLQHRNSSPRLVEPAPSASEMEGIFQAALRAPDHAWLRPWRFITIAGDRRQDFGQVLERCLRQRNPQAEEAALQKARGAPLRAPLVVVVVARLTDHAKVPASEQRLSAGCAAHSLLLAAEACGYAGIWRTGDPASDPAVMAALGLEANEEITGFIYLGTRDGAGKTLPLLDTADFVSNW